MFKDARISTNVLTSFSCTPNAIEVLSPGAHTTIQDTLAYLNVGE